MASNYFTISPTGGTGNAYLDIRATQQNNTTNDRVAIVTITNGAATKTVTATQFGKPSITGLSFPISAPATGASYTFTVHTHYNVQFVDKPDWVKIDDGQGNYISSAATIPSGTANGKTYNLTVDPNADNNDRSTSFGMYHYMYGSIMSDYVSMGISQPQGAEDYITIPSTIALDWDDTNAKSVPVNANVTWSASISNTSEFELAGGNGYVTVRAKANNTGSTRKSTTLSVASTKAGFSYTATCVVTQYRQPTITIVDGGTVPPTGGSKTVSVVSDYYWWIQPTVMPETPSANIPYITMTGKVAGQNMSPTTGANYTLTWTSNDGNIRNDNLYVGYLKTDNSSTGRSATYANYIQNNEASETIDVIPDRIPESGYASSGGGVYTVQVVTGRKWQLNGTPQHCTVSPSTGSGNTTVTITVPPSTVSGSSYHWVENIYFVTNDGGQIASKYVSVWQYDNYTEPAFIVVDPTYIELTTSGAVSNISYDVSANTQWSAVFEDWMHLSTTTGGTGNTTHYFSVDENSGATRDGSIDFTPFGAGVSIAHLYVRQASGATPVVDSIIVNPSSKSIGSGSSLYNEVYVTASTTWSLSKPNWIRWIDSSTFTDTTGGTAGTKKLYMNADANSGSSRTGITTFVAGTASTTHTVTQDAAYEEPVGYLELDPPQISPASSSYQVYEVEVYNPTPHNYMIVYGGDWVKFYDGPYPSTADEVNVIESEERLNIYLEVQAGHNGTTTILFVNEDDPDDYITFVVNQQ